jgi:23S rRNA (adenine2503-C2)-methyltransferase
LAESFKRDAAALDAAGIEQLLADLGEPGYRTRQLTSWLYGRSAPSFEAMTDLPARLRNRLADDWTLTLPEATDVRRSADGTRKYLWRLADGVLVESVGIPSDGRLTVCFSTQAGCVMGCSFCATGRGGFVRDLLPGEIVWQVGLVGADFGKRVTNAVAMGQGEPFNNYEATLGALRLMNLPEGLGIGARHLTVSTCGVVPGIDSPSSSHWPFRCTPQCKTLVTASCPARDGGRYPVCGRHSSTTATRPDGDRHWSSP